ncbi:MAG TPA: ankyrin repeat domain-containing protein [Tepidisphaeraceae bacterium]|jgi:serine/threonine-protein phosphatase 6 regulatory ankyrin repeat subunit B|nr:ankyrin repeat domain-containing protein [Tepidisphaeraceae bacterium]
MKRPKSTASTSSEDRVEQYIRAAAAGDVKRVRQLLDACVDVNAFFKGANALIFASKEGHARVVRLLLERGADPSTKSRTGKYAGNSFPLHALALAAEQGHLEIVQMLIRAGAEVNHSIAFDRDALCAAATGGHTEVVRELLAAGHQIEDGVGLKALRAAVNWSSNQGAALLLIKAGVKVDGEAGANLLQTAAGFHMVSTVKALLDAGVDPTLKNHFGRSALAGLNWHRRHEVATKGREKNPRASERIRQLVANAVASQRRRRRDARS